MTADDIDAADWIVIGHSHFDHLWGAERIALKTGATIIGSYETVRVMEACGVPAKQLMAVSGGERVRLSPDVFVSVYPSLHSCVWSQSGQMQGADEVCLGDIGVAHQDRLARFAGMRDFFANLSPAALAHLGASSQDAKGDGGALAYLFETPEGTLLYKDTSGHWGGVLHDLRPDVAILAAAGRGNIDGEPIQGSLAQYVAREAFLLKPKRVLLGHHDNWLPGFSTPTDTKPIRAELERWLPRTELLEPGYLASTPIFG